MSRKPRFRTPFNSQHAKRSQTLLESVQQHFYHISSSLWGKLSWKMSLLVICEILGLFLNTLIVDDKYFLCNSENLPQPIQMLLFKKQITFSEVFPPVLKSKSIFKPFEKKDGPPSLYVSEMSHCKRREYLNV